MTAPPPRPQLILHVGAPKCGSSALQGALSLTPDLVDGAGRRLRYTAWRQSGGVGGVLRGREVTLLARASPHGYVSWPNVRPDDVDAPVFAALDGLRRAGLRGGYVPVASCEGWISRPKLFATHLARWGYPPVEVVAFLRPVVDWTNAAFWQWGIWNVKTLDQWLARGGMPYRFAEELELWSRIPNVRLRLAPARPDAVARFAAWQGVTLPPAPVGNASSPPALLGVLLRHRRLRPTGHEAAVEFVVQRWCPPVPGRRPWAVLPRHVHALRPVAESTWASLRRLVPAEDLALFRDDPRWTQEKPYHPDIRAGISRLNDPAQLAALHAALATGLARLAEAEGSVPPVPPPCPGPEADIAAWDAALLGMLDALVAADARLRAAAWRAGGLAGVRLRVAMGLAGALSRTQVLVSKSR